MSKHRRKETPCPRVIHKLYWHSNQRTGSPVIFSGHIAQCGHSWIAGSLVWKYVTCRRCLKRFDLKLKRKP